MRTRLAALVLLAILPLVLLLLVGAGQDHTLTLERARSRATDLARLGAEQVDIFKQANSVLRTVRSLAQAQTVDWRNCDALMARLAAGHPQFRSVGLAGSDGTSYCHSVAGHPARFGDPQLLAQVLRERRDDMTVGRFRYNPALKRPTVMVAMPYGQTVTNTIPTSGIVFVGLDLDRLQRIAHNLSDDDKLVVLVVDTADGTVLASRPTGEEPAGARIAASALLDRLRSGAPTGALEAPMQGAQRIFGYALLPGLDDLAIAVALPRETILAKANARFWTAIALALLTTLIAVAAAWLLGGVLQLRAIEVLVATARRLGAGDLKARARIEPWQAPEFRALAQTLGTMAESIEQARLSQDDSDREFRLLADNVNDMITRIDHTGRRLYVTPSCRTLLGYEPDEMLSISSKDAVHPDDWPPLAAFLDAREPEVSTRQYRLRRKDGTYVWVEGSARTMPAQAGRGPDVIVVVRDIEQRIAAEQGLKENEARYRILAEHSTDMVFQLDRNTVRRYVSAASRELVGREPEDLVGAKPVTTAHPEDAAVLEDTFAQLLGGTLQRASRVSRVRHRDGHWVWLEIEMRAVVDARTGEVTGIIGASRDISARKKAEATLEAANRELEALATQDALTGLLNRRGFDRALEAEFGRALRENAHLGLVLIDVDRFKIFNDVYGHQAGDECLRAVTRAVSRGIRGRYDVAARYGGEELAILLPHTDATTTFQMADRIRLAIRGLQISHVGGATAFVTVSAGIACLTAQTPVAEAADLVRAADAALYEAKRGGRDRVCAAPPDWEVADSARRRHALPIPAGG